MNSNLTAYWHIVLKCLTRLCKMPADKAGLLVHSYRLRLLQTPENLRRDTVFHMEPWQFAQRLAGQEDRKLNAQEQTWYEKTVKSAIYEAAIIGTEEEVREFQMA
jgi:hypothetical protein